jgi:type VI secretion system protein ImpL
MTKMAWIRISAITIGVIALAALIWFGGPLIAIADSRPLDGTWVRVGIIGLVVAIAAAFVVRDILHRRKASAALAEAITTSDEPDSDAAVLQETMRDALATLRRAGSASGNYLYDLPWYVIIGPPGAGKTTALVNSGLKFPLARGGTPEAVAGVGGTRYCDWWFSEEAVLIDTAGRYTTQDSDPKGDRKSWLAFLDLLKTNRPKQPINGVIVAISVEDLLTSNAEELTAHANAIRKRLIELHEHLKVDFPVYALLTKADLVAGFMEYFGNLAESERRMVWGHTFQTADRTRNMMGEAPAEYDALIERLNEQLPDRLQDEPTPAARVVAFGFPSQMATLKRPVIDFLNRIFEPTRYHANATLRGFYFTSGTQHGTPIDQLIGTLARNFGAEEVPNLAYSGKGKSFFLTDLLRKVVIGEAGWVSNNQAAVRRSMILKAASFAGIGAVSALAVALWWISFNRNRELIAATNNDVVEYRTIAAPVLRETTVSDRNFGKVLPLLHKLQHLPAGYAAQGEAEPVTATFGLSQRDRLQSASETAYQVGLERMFRSRLIYRLEEQLEANINNPGFVYEGLKVYLMVGGLAPVDREFVTAWMRNDWAESLFPGAANARGRQALEEHLQAMFDLDEGREPFFTLNKALIEDGQRTLARMSIAERAYELLKSQARGMTQRDWVVAYRGGTDTGLVFEGAGGEDLESVRVPFFYTYDGYQTAFLGRLGSIGEQIDRERWVLGAAGQQQAVSAQYSALYQDLLRLYTRDFVAAWQSALRKLKLRPLNTDKPRYVALAAAGAATSPIKQLIESIRDETQLTRERPAAPTQKADAAAAAKGVAADVAGQEAARRAQSAASRAGVNLPANLAQQLAGAGQGGATPQGGFFGQGEAPGANIEAQFKGFHVLLEGDGGRKPVDVLLQNLTDINQNLAIAATNPTQAAAANNALVQQVATLRANASRFPAPFDQMIRNAANEFEGDATGVTVANLQQALGDQVTRVCQQVVTNRYPFVRGSDREVPLADFARLFAPGAIMDKFFKENLAPYVDQSRLPWTWRLDSRVARGLSTVTLRQFQQASDIRDAFFPTGGNLPSFTMAVTPLTLSGDAASAKFEINGTPVVSQQGVNAPTNVNWPGGGVGRSAITLGGGTTGGGFFGSSFFTQPSVVQKEGVWSFFKMLDSGSVLKQGDAVVASFAVGGREVSYQFNVGSLLNPLILPALREFRCPAGI